MTRGRLADHRIKILLVVLSVAFAATLARAVWLQVVRADPLSRMALVQHRETVTIPAPRGAIYDRTGTQLAIGRAATTIWADPRQILAPAEVAEAAAPILQQLPESLLERLSDRSKAFVYVARQADPEVAESLEARNLPGISSYPEERRAYPHRTVGAHVLGFAGIDNRGVAGLEWSLDRVLAGRPGRQTLVKDPSGRSIDVVNAEAEADGQDVHLTLDRHIQAHTEAVLERTVRRWRALSASAIVLDPRTGAILAMAVAPGFDANSFASTPTELTRNRVVTDTYEPGSTFKLIPIAGALAEGIAKPRTSFVLPPRVHVADRVIQESHVRSWERMTVAEIVSRSSNVGTIRLAQKLGKQRVMKWIRRFGFGRRTGIDYPGESRGFVPPGHRWSGSTIGTVPIGHGISVTPVQMAAAYATVANGGVWTQPHVVARAGDGAPPRRARRRVLEPRVARMLVRMLQGVTEEGGTGEAASISGYRVAGKTGTAAKTIEGRLGYSTSRYVASFAGIVPASKPRLVVLVAVDEPRGAIWGGSVAAPAFAEIARFALQYLGVPPDAPPKLE